MIQKLRLKFIGLSMLCLFFLLSGITAGMNILNYRAVIEDADKVLALLSENQGAFPDMQESVSKWLPSGMSPERPYESRYFSVLISSSGKVLKTETSRIFAVNEPVARQYAASAMSKAEAEGFAGDFRFAAVQEGENIRITFLDCGRQLDAFEHFACISIGMALAGFGLTMLAVIFFSGKFIRPAAESYERQKQFITNASHEIRTPLTIIKANADVLKMDGVDSECLDDISRQAERLAALTNDLVSLARLDEENRRLPMTSFPLSEVVDEETKPFEMLARAQSKELIRSIQPLLSLAGDPKAIGHLISILLDNALKYSPPQSIIHLDLKKQNRRIILQIENSSSQTLREESLSRLFERFYRADPSRNSQTGGCGIGLALAKEIVKAHNGKIEASIPKSNTFRITVVLPV